MRKVVVIPARYGSTRFPGKPLVNLWGKPLIQHVYERVKEAGFSEIYVATDDQRIFETVLNFGGRAIMTKSEHPSGTDRIAEAVKHLLLPEDALIINLQGDQPLFPPSYFEVLIKPLLLDTSISMATLATPIKNEKDLHNPNRVKVVLNNRGFALYFSRAAIPYFRPPGLEPLYLKHIGVYAYRKPFLETFVNLPQGPLERSEKLEQLRALEYGYSVYVSIVAEDVPEVDTPEDLENIKRLAGERC